VDDCSSVSDRTLNQPQLFLSGLASTDCLGHPAGTVLGNPCSCCSLLVKSLLNARKKTLILCPLIFRALNSSVVPAGASSQNKISKGYTAPLQFLLSGRKEPAGGWQRQQAPRTSRLPDTQLLKIIWEQSFLSMQVQYLSTVSFARC